MRKEVKRAVWNRDKYQCAYCGEHLDENTATVDHVKPRSRLKRGDKSAIDNLVTACKPCNQKKGDRGDTSGTCIVIPAHKTGKYLQTMVY